MIHYTFIILLISFLSESSQAARENDFSYPQLNTPLITTFLDNYDQPPIVPQQSIHKNGLENTPLLNQQKKLRFNPYLAVHPNSGSLKTQFDIALPPNLSGLQSLTWIYDSFKQGDQGYGIGFSLNLPRIIQNNRGAFFPKFYVQQLGDSELIQDTSFSLDGEKKEFLLQQAGALNITEDVSIELYRPLFETSFHHFYRLVHHGWIVLSLDGTSYLFNEQGQLVYQQQAISGGSLGISFLWKHGQLVQVEEGIHESHPLWTMNLHYTGTPLQFLPLESQGQFFFPEQLTSVTVRYHESFESTSYHFYYDEDHYLTKVLQDQAFRPLFLGEYQALAAGQERVEYNTVEENVNYHFWMSTSGLHIQPIKSSQDHIDLYIDFNNDGLDDKLRIDLSEKTTYLRDLYRYQLFQKEYKDQDHFPLITNTSSTHRRIDMQMRFRDGFVSLLDELNRLKKTKYSFYMAVKQKNEQGVVSTHYQQVYHLFENDHFFPEYIIFNHMWSVWHYGKQGIFSYSYEVPSYDISTASFRWVDLNHDLRKDLVVCPGKEGTPQIFYQVGPHQSEGQDSSLIFKSTLTSFDLTHLKKSDVFTCHHHSLFQDFNQDGIVDILTDNHLYLRGHQGSYYHKTLSKDELHQLFEDDSKQRSQQRDLLWIDRDHDGRYEGVKGKAFLIDQEKGEELLITAGKTYISPIQAYHKSLVKMDSLYGGAIRIKYQQQDGVWIVHQMMKDAGPDQLTEVHTYQYEDKLRDDYTGAFIGFGQQKERIAFLDQEGHSQGQEAVTIETRFSQMNRQSDPLYYLSHHHLLGKIQSKTFFNDKGKLLREDLFDWGLLDFNRGRKWFFLREEQQKKNGLLISDHQTIYELDKNQEILISKKQTHDHLTKKSRYFYKSKEHRSHLEILDFFSRDSDPIFSVSYVYNDQGLVSEKHVHNGEQTMTQIYTYDDFGRQIRLEKNNGFWEDYHYDSYSPIVNTTTNELGTTSQKASLLSSHPISKTDIYGSHFYFDFTPDGFLTSLTKGDEQLSLFSMPLSPLCQQDSCRTQQIFPFTEKGLQKKLVLDGLGRTQEIISNLGWMASVTTGKSFFVDDHLWKQDPSQILWGTSDEITKLRISLEKYKPKPIPSLFTDMQSKENPNRSPFKYTSSTKRNALGEIIALKDADDRSWIYQRQSQYHGDLYEECESLVDLTTKDHENVSTVCTNKQHQKTREVYQGEEYVYQRDSLGQLLSIPSLGLNYDYDRWGNLKSSESLMEKSLSPRWTKIEQEWDPILNSFKMKNTGWTIQFDPHQRPLKIINEDQHPHELSEDFQYDKSLLQKHRWMNDQSTTIMEEDIDYDHEGKITKRLIGPYQFDYRYDRYGYLMGKTIYKHEQVLHDFKYHYDHFMNIKSIEPHLSHIDIHPLGPLEEIAYSNEAKLNLRWGFPQQGHLPLQVSFLPPPSKNSINDDHLRWIMPRPSMGEVLRERGISDVFEEMSLYHRSKPKDSFLWSEQYRLNSQLKVAQRRTIVMTDLYESVFYYNEQTQKLLQNDPLDYWYGNDLQNQMYRLNLPEHLRRHNLQVPVYKDDSPEHGSRDDEGRITHVQQTPLSYHHDLLLSLGNINFYYEHNGHLKIACPKSMGLNPVNLWSQCLIYLDEDTFVVKGHLVIRERINQQVIGFWIDQTFMPAVSDHLGSIKAIFSTSGDRVVLSREYSAWGMKQEKIYTPHAQERALVKLIPWSFAGLIDPLSVFTDKHTPTLYWSQSRVYSPTLREWLTVDPLVKMDPQSLVEMPGNWNAVEYASGDPVNLVDTSGHFAHVALGGLAGGLISGAGGYLAGMNSPSPMKSAMIGFVTGFSMGSSAALTLGASALAQGAITSIFGFTGNLSAQMAINRSIDIGQAGLSIAGGFLGAGFSSMLSSSFSQIGRDIGSGISLMSLDVFSSMALDHYKGNDSFNRGGFNSFSKSGKNNYMTSFSDSHKFQTNVSL